MKRYFVIHFCIFIFIFNGLIYIQNWKSERHTIQRVVCLHFRLCSSSLGICDHNTHTLGLVIRLISQKVKHHRCANYKIKLPKEILQFSEWKKWQKFQLYIQIQWPKYMYPYISVIMKRKIKVYTQFCCICIQKWKYWSTLV